MAICLLSCKKDKVEPTVVTLGEGYDFIEGDWNWSQAITCWSFSNFPSYSGKKFYVYKDDISEYCKLNISHNAVLTIETQDGTKTMQLTPNGVFSVGENRVAHFQNENGESIIFTWSQSSNTIDTEYRFFSFSHTYCNTGFLILNNSYAKV